MRKTIEPQMTFGQTPIEQIKFDMRVRDEIPKLLFFIVLLLSVFSSHLYADTSVSGIISLDTTWTAADSPFIVTGDLIVQGKDGADGVTTLSIEPGAVIKFNSSRKITIGAVTGDPGALIAQGTAGAPVTFTSSQADPTPGSWLNITFQKTAHSSSLLEYCNIEYAGYGNYGAVYCNYSSPTITNCQINNSSSAGIYFYSSSASISGCLFTGNAGYDLYYYSGTNGGQISDSEFSTVYLIYANTVEFSNNTINYRDDFASKIYADQVGGLMTGTFNNVDTQSYIEVQGGAISHDTTWTSAINCHITADVTVKGSDGDDGVTTLSIEPGAVIKFNSSRKITIGAVTGDPGALIAQGTAGAPVTFTSSQADPTPGSWLNITFQKTAHSSSLLEYCNIEYAGYGNYGAVYCNYSSPTITNCQINNSSSAGIYFYSSSASISGCLFTGNAGYDLYYYSGTNGGQISDSEFSTVYLIYANTVEFSNNTINYRDDFASKIYADQVGGLMTGTFNNVDTQSYIEVQGGMISHDATWTSAINCHITADVTVKGSDGDDGVTTLSIEPGAVIKFNSSRKITIGAVTGDPGALIAQGTAGAPVTFTSSQADPTPGSWLNITFQKTAHSSSLLEYCNIEYAGYGNYGAVYCNYSSPTITNCQINNSSSAGIYFYSSSASISGCLFTGNAGYDLYYYSGTNGGQIADSEFSTVYLIYANTVAFSNNTINYRDDFASKIYADQVGEFMTGTFNNVDTQSYIEVQGGAISHDATWTAALKYHILGNITVQGADGTDSVTTLTLVPGTELRFTGSYSLTIGASLGDPGAIVAQGSASNPVVFTSSSATPAAGDWSNIQFYTTTDTSSIMDHCLVEYGGYSSGSVYLYNASPTIRNTTIRYSKNAGLYASGNGCSGTVINCNTVTNNNTYGIQWTNIPPAELSMNNFTDNGNYGIYYSYSTEMTAENNWWGDAAGPNQSGDAIYGTVDADPWSTAENQCIASGENHPPYEPNTPYPANQAIRVAVKSGFALSWSGDDPDVLDTVAYDLYWGNDPASLTLIAQNIDANQYSMTGLVSGISYYWQIIAKDNHGLETGGPVWSFTSDGDPPDLVIGQVTANPNGNLQSGQSVTLTATVRNSGSGPVVDPFTVNFQVDSTTIGSSAVDQILLAGQTIQIAQSWTYSGDDPGIIITADDQSQVIETNEDNNCFVALLSKVADNTAPALITTSPADGAYLQQAQQISVTLADSQGAVDDAVVISSFSVTDAGQQNVTGAISEEGDIFTFVPTSQALEDGNYQVGFTAADTYGNTQNYGFCFTIDSMPPGKPVITGSTVYSGTIQPRPTENISEQFVVYITGTRDVGTSLWLDGVMVAENGDSEWLVEVTLSPGGNTFGFWLVDLAGNAGEAEWIDIWLETGKIVRFEYNGDGRMTRSIRLE